jgi:hypothetical protein
LILQRAGRLLDLFGNASMERKRKKKLRTKIGGMDERLKQKKTRKLKKKKKTMGKEKKKKKKEEKRKARTKNWMRKAETAM